MSLKKLKVDDHEKSTSIYFDIIKDTKPLSKSEEKILWKKFHEQKDLSAREKLIKANLRFVPTIAKKFRGCGLPFADIIEEGNIGLINAIDRFNPQKDNKIISYAVWWIRKSIIEAIEKKGVIDAENIDDISAPSNNKKNFINDNFIIHEKEIFENNNDKKIYIKEIINQLFEGIPEKEQLMLSDYYGLNGDTQRTLDEIGIEVNLTKERVRQINEKTLKKMRANALLKNINL